MKVLILTTQGPGARSGVRSYSEIIAAKLKKDGATVHIQVPGDAPYFVIKVCAIMTRFFRLFSADVREMWHQTRIYIETYMLCRKYCDVDLVHAQDAVTGSAAKSALRGRVPVLVTCHFNESPVTEVIKQRHLGANAQRFLMWWFGVHFKKLDHFICVSNYLAEKARPWIRQDASLKVIHNGISMKELQKNSVTKEKGMSVVINVGFIEPRKNQLFLVEVANVLREENIEFWFLGDGFGRQEVEDKIKDYRLEHSVKLLGWQQGVEKYMEQADLMLHVALQECFGLVIAEAMLNKCPVMALGVGGVPELFSDEDEESVISPEIAPSEMAQIIKNNLFNKEKMQALRTKQYTFAVNNFTDDIMYDKLKQTYHELLNTNSLKS